MENNDKIYMSEMSDVKCHVECKRTNQQLQDGKSQEILTFSEPTVVNNLTSFYRTHKLKIFQFVKALLLISFLGYVGYSLYVEFGDEGSIRLLVCTLFGILLIFWRFIKTRLSGQIFPKRCTVFWTKKVLRKVLRWVLNVGVGGAALAYTVVFSLIDNPENLVSMIGIVILVCLLYATSTNREKVNWHTVYWGLMTQLLFGILFVSTDVGIASMEYLSDRVLEFTSFSDTGAEFVFTEKYKDFQIIFQSMPQILYFVTMINVLQYLGVTTFLVKTFGSFLAFCLGTRPVESMVAAANIFMAISEAFMMVRVYLDNISTSQLFSMMVCGLASVSGSALLFYQTLGVPMSQMITASVMSAPAALVCAKLNVPEEEEEHYHNSTTGEQKEEINNGVNIEDKEISGSNNILEAITKGAQLGTAIVVSIVVHMLIYLSLVDFLNSTGNWFGNRVAIDDLSFEKLLAFILWPVAFILGIPSQDCFIIGRFLGVRAILGVGLAYIQMGQYVENREQLVEYKTIYNDTEYMSNGDISLPMWNQTLEGGVLQDRSVLIGTYALCGFSALPNIGIALGVLSSVAPKRLNEATRFSIRAFVVSTMASLLTACVAGLLYTPI